MLFTRKRTDVHDISIEINNITISRVKTVKFLGVILDEKYHGKIILITYQKRFLSALPLCLN